MDGSDDERIRRLQRIAYGANASAEERGAALDELEMLEQRGAASADDSAAGPARDGADGSDGSEPDDGAVDATATPTSRRSRGFAIRAGLIAGAAALAVGIGAGFAVGWQFRPSGLPMESGAAGPSAPVELGPRLHADVFASMPIALETDAARVFDRAPTPVDTPRVETPLAEVTSLVEPIETRLLTTGADGTGVFGARDATDICLIAVFTDGGAASVCTQRGRFPTDGLRMSAGGPGVIVYIAWSPDGVLHLTTR